MKKTSIALATALGLLSVPSFATTFQASGFFNGVVTSDEHSNRDADNLTKLGIQLVANISDKVSGTFQAVSRVNAWDDSIGRETSIEYGFLSYALDEDTTLRAGRLRLPFFMHSEYVDVGAAVPWIEAPNSVYYQLPTNAYDGIDAIHTMLVGDAQLTLQGFVGQAKAPVNAGGVKSEVHLNRAFGGNATISYNDWNVRLAYGQADMAFSLDKLTQMGLQDGVSKLTEGGNQALAAAAAMAATDPAQAALLQSKGASLLTEAGQYQFILDELPREAKTSIYNLGFNGYVTDNLTVLGEYVYIDTDHAVENNDKGFYVAATYAFNGDFKLTGTYSAREELRNTETYKAETEEFIVTAAYQLGDNWIAKAEAKHSNRDQTANGVKTSTDANTYAVSINYIF